MNNIIDKINTLAHSPNSNEQKISRFIIAQHFNLATFSATKIAAILGISDASIIRYAKKLGCSGFPDLKLTLVALAAHRPSGTTVPLYGTIAACDPTEQIIEKAKQLFVTTISQSLNLLEANVIDQAAQQLSHANKIVLCGIGTSALVAADINYKLIRAGFNVQFNQDYHMQIVQASLLKSGEVLFVVSARGNTPEVLTAMAKAKQHGATIIALTRYGRDKVAQGADYLIPYSYTEEHTQLGMVTPQLLQMAAFDVLFFKLITLIDPVSMHTALNAIHPI